MTAISAIVSAVVPLVVQTTYGTPRVSASRSSNCRVMRPCEMHLSLIAAVTLAISGAPKSVDHQGIIAVVI